MQQQFSTTQNAGAQPLVYDNLQMRRVPTWPNINEMTTGNVGNQYYSSMSMYPNGQPAGFFPRSNSLNSMTEVMVPMTGVVQGNTEAMQNSLLAFPTVGANHYMPAHFMCRQSSQDLQAPCTPPAGYQQQPIQAWPYNHYNNTPPATLQYPPPQQAMMYNVGGEREATPKARKPPLKRKSVDYTVDGSPFHGSNIRHTLMLNKQVQWPRLIYETRCAKSPNAQQSGEKNTGGKINSTSSEQISSMLFMPTHRPRSPKKRPWKGGERKVKFIPKKVPKRVKSRKRSVERVLKSCAKKLRESSIEEVSENRPKRSTSIPLKKEALVKAIPAKLNMPMSLGYSQTPPESSDEETDEVETENVAQPVDNKVDPKNPNGREANGLELAPKSVCTKPVPAPTLPQSYRSEILLEKPTKLFTFPTKLPIVGTQRVNKAEIRLDNKKMQTTFPEEGDILSVKSSLASPKELTPTALHPSSDITTPGSSCRLAGMKPPIPYTPPNEKIIKPKPKLTLKPTVPPLKRHNWSPAPLVADFANLPLIIERTVKDEPWQTVGGNRKYKSNPEVRQSAQSPELVKSPPPSKQALHPKEQKKSRRRRRRKKTRVAETAKVESVPSTTAPEEPLAQAPSKRKSRCDLLMDCLQRTFPFVWRKEKTN